MSFWEGGMTSWGDAMIFLLMVNYQLSLKVVRENNIALTFTDGELPTFTEGSKKTKKFSQNSDVSPRKGLNSFFNQGIPPGKGNI